MMSSRPNDPPVRSIAVCPVGFVLTPAAGQALKAAREQIQAQVGQWLKEAAHANALL